MDGWKRVWDFYGLPTFSTFSTSPFLSLSFSVAEEGFADAASNWWWKNTLVRSLARHPLSTPRPSLSLPLPFLLVLRRSSYDTPATTVLKAILRLL